MPIITLRFKDIKIRDYPLTAGQTLTIGRKHSNDIVIDNLAVSGNHAQIEGVASTYILRDMDSTNGTFVNEEKISLHNLRHNDVILIGNHKLVFDYSDRLSTLNVHDDYDVDKTRILDTSAYHGPARKSTGSSPSTSNIAKPQSFFSKLLKMIFG